MKEKPSMEEPGFDVFGVGQCSLDYVGKIDAYPPPDRKCEMSEGIIQGGGPVATALVALSRWGRSCAFAGVRGDDFFGEMIHGSLTREGVDIEGLAVRKGHESQFAFIAAEPAAGRRTIFWKRPTGPILRPDEIDYQKLDRSRVLLIDGAFSDASLQACRAARERGIPVVADADTFREERVELARVTDFFIASEHFASALLARDDPEEACRRISDLGPRVAAVTLGARGYVALAEGRWVHKPAYPVEAVDTTGCGDVFHAGFIHGLLQDWDLERCFDFAAWAAAMVSLKMGGRSGIPSLREIREQGFG